MSNKKVFIGIIIVGVLYYFFRNTKPLKQMLMNDSSTQTEIEEEFKVIESEPEITEEFQVIKSELKEEIVEEIVNETDSVSSEEQIPEFTSFSLVELKSIAKTKGIKGFSKLNKQTLIEKLKIM